MAIDANLLKERIIERLKEYDAYIDDELPDYIIVMIANKKTLEQIKSDLELFLGDHIETFMKWLNSALNDSDDIEGRASEGTPYPSSPLSVDSIENKSSKMTSKRSRTPTVTSTVTSMATKIVSPDQSVAKRRNMDLSPPRRGVQKIKLPPEPRVKRSRKNSQDEDLRSVINRQRNNSGAAATVSTTTDATYSDYEGEEEDNKVGVSSVVQLPQKVDRPKRSGGGTGRLLQKAISDIHGVSKRKRKKSRERKHSQPTTELETELKQEKVELDEPVIEDPINVEPEVKKKKSIRERLDPTPEHDDDITEFTVIEEATLAAVRKVLPASRNKPIDLRHILKNKKNKPLDNADDHANSTTTTTTASTTTRFIVTLDNKVDPTIAKITSSSRGEEEVSSVSKGLPERCRFWPNCKNGDSCPYHHPTTPCRLFPKCKYGQKCFYVHPQCKYDGRCTNPACSYLHSVPKLTSVQQQQSNMFSIPIAAPFPPMATQFGYTTAGSGSISHTRSIRTKFPSKSALSWAPGKS